MWKHDKINCPSWNSIFFRQDVFFSLGLGDLKIYFRKRSSKLPVIYEPLRTYNLFLDQNCHVFSRKKSKHQLFVTEYWISETEMKGFCNFLGNTVKPMKILWKYVFLEVSSLCRVCFLIIYLRYFTFFIKKT